MAENLSKAGISVFAIPFSAAYAYMPRVNKIYIGKILEFFNFFK